MESLIMQLVKGGYSSKYWSSGIKFGVYKQFIRPIAEYGLQLKIMDDPEAAQLKASRILQQLPWNSSIQAIRRLFCMESMQCRNKILNAKFYRSIHRLKDYAQITQLVQLASNQPKSVYRDSLKLNEYMRDLKNASSNMELKAKIKDITKQI
jgi:hypothetical protein